jgi:hypothetical protein
MAISPLIKLHDSLDGRVKDMEDSSRKQTAAEVSAGTIPVNYSYKPYNVKRGGARGDFDPATGLGANDWAAIQSTFYAAMEEPGGAEIILPPGRYFIEDVVPYDVTTNPGSGHLVLGVGGTPGAAKNIIIRGEGAEIYQGVAGRLFALYGCVNVRISGIRWFGYRGGTLASGRENDALIMILDESRDIELDKNYMVCGFGDAVYVNGDMAQLSFDRQPQDVNIHHNVLKQYYGNGTFVGSGGGGTMSRFAIAMIDVTGAKVHHNTIYGTIDLEPNNDDEHIESVDVSSNKFRSGHVTAQGTIGSDYWHDEPLNYSGGATIPQNVTITSVASAPSVSNNRVCANTFEYGKIGFGANPKTFDLIQGNFFEVGWIESFFGATSRTKIIDNIANEPRGTNDIFIELTESISLSEVSGNAARGANWSSCVGFTGSGADGGNNIWGPNTAESGTPTNVTPAASSQVCGVPIRIAWTPVVTFATVGNLSVAYSGQVAEAALMGKSVTVHFRITTTTFTHSSASGELRITGLPYTARNNTVAYNGHLRWQGLTLAAGYTEVIAKIEPNTNYISFEMVGSAQTRTALSITQAPTGATVELIGSITYEIV